MPRFLILLILLPAIAIAQSKDSTEQKDFTFVPLPVIFKSPETSWAFGVGTFFAFKLPGQGAEVRPSQIQLGGAYTLNEQFLSYLPFDIYINGGKHYLRGEVGYYKYFYYYYGIGPDAREINEERYDVDYPRVDLNYLFQINANSFIGPRAYIEDYQTFDLIEGGELASGNVPGAEGGFSNGIGIAYNFDSRDAVFFPRSGWRIDASLLNFNGFVASDYNFTKLSLDVSHYLPIGEKSMIGFNLYQEYNFGDVPFSQMSQVGGSRKHRGYYKGRFRDNQMFEFQTEFRGPVFWRCGIAVFAGIGQVWGPDHAFSVNNLKWNLGIGGRFTIDKKRMVNGRGDLGFGDGQTGTYITVGEAF